MSLGRLVPWMGWDEWETVGKCLYDDTALSQGLDIVSAWRIRGRVPVGVDATALLRETQQAYDILCTMIWRICNSYSCLLSMQRSGRERIGCSDSLAVFVGLGAFCEWGC